MEAPETLKRTWLNRLVEVLQPVSLRADRLSTTSLFAGLGRRELELAAGLLSETFVERHSRLTIQGIPASRFWLIVEGQALVSADARPLRMAGAGDPIGLPSLLLAQPAGETTLALTGIRAFETDARRFAELLNIAPIRFRLSAAAGLTAVKRSTRRRSSAAG